MNLYGIRFFFACNCNSYFHFLGGGERFGLRVDIIIYSSSLAEGLSRYEAVLNSFWECVNCNVRIGLKKKVFQNIVFSNLDECFPCRV